MLNTANTYSSFSSFSACQLWRSAANDTFPSCKLPAKCVNIRSLWDDMNDPTFAMPRYLNICCLQTNVMEGVLRFNEYVSVLRAIALYILIAYDCLIQTTVRLLKVGFNEPIEEDAVIGGSVRNAADALSILQDTHRVRILCRFTSLMLFSRDPLTYRP
jgi:hypothetical protein